MSINVTAPEGPFSIQLEYRGYSIIIFKSEKFDPYDDNGSTMKCDIKVLRGGQDVTTELDEFMSPTAEHLKQIYDWIDNKNQKAGHIWYVTSCENCGNTETVQQRVI
jgi:hypothetical protein|tara:strand:+ start:7545 stop:7865 length:321 start_codon:yes stop_codon:yes gene_type:complete